MKRAFLAATLALSLVGCTTPTQYTDKPMVAFDKNTLYAIEETDRGFTVSVHYSKFQLNAEGTVALLVCRQQLMAIAFDHARKVGRAIKPLNEQAVRVSTGRNTPVFFITSCSAQVEAEWLK